MFGKLDNVFDLVEFIEVNRVLGAQKFQLYVQSVGPRVASCMRVYARRGIVDIQPWILPSDIAGGTYYHGQVMAINECLYRMMYLSKYVISQDLDELIVPKSSDNWSSMVNNINKDTRKDVRRIASYSFRNRFFPTTWPYSTAGRFKTLIVMHADKRLYPFNRRSKVMARPERVLIWHVHLIFDSSLVRRGDANIGVNAKHGELFHYKRGVRVARKTTVYRMNNFKLAILRGLQHDPAAICFTSRM